MFSVWLLIHLMDHWWIKISFLVVDLVFSLDLGGIFVFFKALTVSFQRQSQFLMYRRRFMDIEREQVKEHQRHRKHLKRTARSNLTTCLQVSSLQQHHIYIAYLTSTKKVYFHLFLHNGCSLLFWCLSCIQATVNSFHDWLVTVK